MKQKQEPVHNKQTNINESAYKPINPYQIIPPSNKPSVRFLNGSHLGDPIHSLDKKYREYKQQCQNVAFKLRCKPCTSPGAELDMVSNALAQPFIKIPQSSVPQSPLWSADETLTAPAHSERSSVDLRCCPPFCTTTIPPKSSLSSGIIVALLRERLYVGSC